MLRRALVVLAGAFALATLVRILLPRFASDETRIRLLLAEACESYEEGAARGVAEVFAPDWREPRTGAGREDLRAALLAHAHVERDPRTGAFTGRAAIDKETLVIRVDEAGATATAEFAFSLARLHKDDLRPVWRAAVVLGLEDRPEGWRIVSVEWSSLEGRPPF